MDRDRRRRLAAIGLNLCVLAHYMPRKRLWARPWLRRRNTESVYHRLVRELSLEDPETLRNFIRLNRDQYHELLRRVTPLIEKQDTNMRKSVSAGERLTLTLRYLATGMYILYYENIVKEAHVLYIFPSPKNFWEDADFSQYSLPAIYVKVQKTSANFWQIISSKTK